MKVLHICETARGGVGTYIDTLTGLERGRIDSLVLMPDAHQSMLDLATPRQTFRLSGRSAGSLVRLAVAAIRTRFSFRPDIIFCHSTFSLLPLLILRPLSPGVKFIYCSHGWAGAREMDRVSKASLIRRIEGALCGLAHRVVNVSRTDLEFAHVQGYHGHHILIENAVRPAREPGVPMDLPGAGSTETAIHLLFVGRLDRQKGLDLLLAAYARARRSNPALRLHVIGEAVVSITVGSGRDMPVSEVNFLGWIGGDQIDSYYRAADLVVMPSRWEAFGLVVAEAYRNGTPVLTSDRGALPDLVDEGVTGFVVPLDHDWLVEALAGLDKTRLQAMRSACFARFNARFHADRLGREIISLYHELVTA